MEQREKPFQIEQHTFQRAECARRNIIQAIEPEASQLDLLLWLHMTILVGGMRWCLALMLILDARRDGMP